MRNKIEISTDKTRLDFPVIVDFLHNHSYWARTRPESVIRKSIENSLCFGMYDGPGMIGFARAVTDYSTFYYLADVFVLPACRNRGLGHRLMNFVLDHPDLRGLRGSLTTQTAHKFYEEFGFSRDSEIVRTRVMSNGP